MMRRILLIEDDPAIRDNLVWLLETHGYEVAAAAGGEEGLRQAGDERPDLVLCDVMMPGLDGLDVLAALRRQPETAALPFIFLTARAAREDLRIGMTAGADDYITKPFAAEEVLDAVRARLERQSQLADQHEARLEELRVSIARALPHELRTPLTTILGYSELLLEEKGMEPEMALQAAADIHEAGRRLERTVERYDAFTHLMLAAASSTFSGAAPGGRVAEADGLVAGVASQVATEHGRLVDLYVRAAPSGTLAYETQLRHAVRELIDNAFKFSPLGSPVGVGARVHGDAFVVQVRDAGCGFDPSDVQRAGAFLQFDRHRHEQQGTGLGLAIVRGVADLFGGTFVIDSTPGSGTTACLTLPSF